MTWSKFALLTLIAVGGSAFYGASLATALPGWEVWKGASWLTLSAGTGWLLLIPCLYFASGTRSFVGILEACLLAMAVGEAVLAVGAVTNFTGVSSGVPFNGALVGVSNVAMLGMLTYLLKRESVPARATVTLWFLVLDGGGALAFWGFHRLIFGGFL